MFGTFVYNSSSACFTDSLLLVDGGIERLAPYADAFEKCGFAVVHWVDDLSFRIEWEDAFKSGSAKLAIICEPDDYIPYDVLTCVQRYVVSFENLFPQLEADALRAAEGLDFDFLAEGYARASIARLDCSHTKQFLRDCMESVEVAQRVYDKLCMQLGNSAAQATGWRDWAWLAEDKARADVIAARFGLTDESNALIDGPFASFMLDGYGKLSSELSDESPVMVSRAMDYMNDVGSGKFAIVVMDGMSEFDWRIISESFSGITYEQNAVFAMVPTVTSISRQCLLSDKFPVQLASAWTQGKEKNEFVDCCLNLGFEKELVFYGRGYEVEIPKQTQCAAVIIADVDERVHGQYGGRRGMLADMRLLAQGGRLAALVERLSTQGFTVFVTADHGNTPVIGRGRVTCTGVETASKGKRMIVFKDFADADATREKYDLIEFPGFYLNKSYNYFLCRSGESFDNPGENVMSHGGISIDEVIVPFITVRAGA